MGKKNTLLLALFLGLTGALYAQHSIARIWNDKVLDAIHGDFARPTVHARNLFHTSVVMYDAWAVYTPNADTYLLGKTLHGYTCHFKGVQPPADVKAAQEEAISFAVYRMLRHRFQKSPRVDDLYYELDRLMDDLGYDKNNTSEEYTCGPAELGNYIARQMIEYGLQDGSNEAETYAIRFYKPVNPPLNVEVSGNPDILDLNRWQPLKLKQFIDQGGNLITDNTQKFLSPEWGQVAPFSLQPEDATIYQRDGFDYWVYHDPGPPPYLDTTAAGGVSEEYKWGQLLVAAWSSHLHPDDGVIWDISPASLGNIQDYPTDLAGYRDFYDFEEGGDPGRGYPVNPKTGQPYAPQLVHRGDYARVLAEFWADGPNSGTPPGHWFEILNYVSDRPELEKKLRGQGPVLTDLEWDVKAYFALGGAMHDVAISAWGIKGWYDSSRPISAIRGMAELGQSSDPNQPNYHPGGVLLVPGFIELIKPGDPLAGPDGRHIDKIKVRAWKGPGFVQSPATDVAGVDWVRAADWWPYQRPSFVTPPFAGYISGHSTYSRAAAELLTALTGDPFFPGGLGEFHCPENEYLVFEDGPSEDITLQWATYRDASDQCSLSRIWGGIHPPFDDMPGRFIGMKIGVEALAYAEQYFTKTETPGNVEAFNLFPNPTSCCVHIEFPFEGRLPVKIYQMDGRLAQTAELNFTDNRAFLDLGNLPVGVYFIVSQDENGESRFERKVVRI